MRNIFAQGQKQDIAQVLQNRDRRNALQTKLVIVNSSKTIAVAKLNIPGPIKNNEVIQHFFENELLHFQKQLQNHGILFEIVQEWLKAGTGPERFYVIDQSPTLVKRLSVAFEDSTSARRLFDIDVLVQKNHNVIPLSRLASGHAPRQCLLCDHFAKECGRTRVHSVKELQKRVSELINDSLNKSIQHQTIHTLTRLGIEAMLDEVIAWPKPGLVDPLEHDSHPDMDHFLFIKSALSLENYLKQCALIGLTYAGTDYHEVFEEIRWYGKQAEKTMFTVTKGVNTHKGVIFSLGIMMTATALALNHQELNIKTIRFIIKQMVKGLWNTDLQHINHHHLTAGENQYQKYHLGGIRTEAMQGYPCVFEHGVKAYKATSDLPQNDRLIITLMNIARYTADSNLIKRAGSPAIIEWKNHQIDRFFELGATITPKGRQFLLDLQTQFAVKQLSLGGSADLLVLTIFINKVEEKFKNGF